jgi:uncharacterized protein with von Willebrand factor type A (vWA) domain
VKGQLIEDILLALLAAPQLAIFFEKFPRLKNALLRDMPRWRERLRARLQHTPRPRQAWRKKYRNTKTANNSPARRSTLVCPQRSGYCRR